MDISGSHRIPAPRAAVWRGLNDPETLKSSIPGCESIERTGEGEFRGVVGAKVGPMRASLSGDIAVSGGPESFTLTVKGADEKAGGGEGTADVTLAEEQGETILTYAGRFEATGKISQLGARLLTGVARTGVEAFLARFSDAVGEAGAASPQPERLDDASPLAPDAESAPASIETAPGEPGFAEPAPAEPAPLQPAPGAIAPTAIPDVPDAAQIAAIEATEPAAAGGGVVTRIMLIAAIVVVVAVGVYFFMFQTPPPATPAG